MRLTAADLAAALALGALLALFPDALGGSLGEGDAVANDLFQPSEAVNPSKF